MSRLVDPTFWRGRRVFLTGYTGFKGTWARLWLERLGAEVHGFARPPHDEPSLHQLVGPEGLVSETIADLAETDRLAAALAAARPEIVLHLAAQALVRRSYTAPVETFATNVGGTVVLLEALRTVASVRTVLVVTTDKVYRNDENGRLFREDDPLGGDDPYSASKAACEMAVGAYRAAFFAPAGIALATARGGNVIGGGDFAADRLVPDAVRAALDGRALELRSPGATRPWQHVLDCLNGYFCFAESLDRREAIPAALNFGPPAEESSLSVAAVADAIAAGLRVDRPWRPSAEVAPPREMRTLGLDPALAAATLDWHSRFDQPTALAWTGRWYDGWRHGDTPRSLTLAQIDGFMARA